MKDRLKTSGIIVKISIVVEPIEFELSGYGSSSLKISDGHDIVLRKSNYADSRTLAISCDKSAIDIPRDLVKMLTNSDAKGILRITVE